MKEMIKQKMLKLHRHSSSSIEKSGERIEFRFSSIQAIQVPKGWDKLSVSLISVETGKTVGRTGKSSVWNGNCRWTETLLESIWVSQDDTSKELEQCPYKLLVSTGSARSGILGEAEINLAGHMNLETSIPIALPLKKCIHGTILQVDIRCLNPRTKSRNERWKGTGHFTEDANADYDGIDNNSDMSGRRFSRSEGSSSSSNFFSASRPGERGSRETSLSAGGSHRSFDSLEDSSGRESFSPHRNSGEIANGLIGRHDSTGSQNSVPYVSYLVSASPKSNNSPHYLGASGSEKYLNNPREDSGHMSHSIPTSPLRTSGSSELVLAEGFTAEEIRAQARMWESNARKLMLDLEFSRRESNDLIGNLEIANTELSALQGECDGLKQEIKHLKVLLDESATKEKATESLKDQMQDKSDIRTELEKEIRFQKDSNDDLSLQLRKTQESNLELLAILQELEETIEIQKVQIESFSTPKSNPADADMKPSHGQEDGGEACTNEKVSQKKMREVFYDSDLEGSFLDAETELLVHVEENDNGKTEAQLQQFLESQKNLENTILYLEKTLDEKAQMIELKQDLMAQNLLDYESEWRAILLLKEQEILDLEAKLSGAFAAQVSKDQPRQNPDLIEEMKALKDNVKWPEKDCTELADENLQILLQLKESRKDLSTSCAFINSSFDEGLTGVSPNTEESEIRKLESQSKTWHPKEEVNKRELGVRNDYLQIYCNDLESKCTDLEFQLQAFKERASYLDDELKKCLARAENQQNEIAELNQPLESHQEGKPNPFSQEEQPEVAKDNLDQLNGSLENLCVPEDNVECGEEENGVIALDAYKAEKGMEDNLEDNFHSQLERLNEELKSSLKEMGKQLQEKISETEKLKLDYLLKEEEIEAQRSNQRDLEVQISNLQNIKSELEGTLEIMKRGRITSQCFSDVSDNLELEGGKDSDISDNKILERNLRELESCKHDLELNLEELEQENVHLSERISGMEAQLRYLTDARESSRLELQQSETHSIKLQDEIRRLESEMEQHKVDMREKMQDMQNRWLDAQQECEYLKKANPQLQATAESLIEECSSLQNSNSELRQQRLELHNRCSALEAELRVSHDNVTDCSKKLEALEEKFSLLLDEIVLKEDVSHLSIQMPVTQYDSDEMASEAIHESVDEIHPETFEEVEGSNLSSEMKLDTVRAQYETKIIELMAELTTSRRNHEVAVVNHEKLRQLFEHTRSNEEKLRDTVNKLESELKACEYQRLQWSEEISTFKLQLQKIPVLQDEVLSLKNTLIEMKFEKQRLEASLQLISGDYEELKDERILLFQKISSMQKAVYELDDCKRSKIALEEKNLRLEGDLTAREALCAQDAYLKNELGRMKRSNSQLQWKIKCLEDKKDECQLKALALEEELEQKKGKHDQNQPTAIILDLYTGPNGSSSVSEATKFSQEEVAGTATQFNRNHQVQQISQSVENETVVQTNIQVSEQYKNVGSFQEIVDITSRVQSLEIELAEALDANEMYRMQLKSFLSEEQLNRSDAPINLDTTSTLSSLETELRELRERYLYISLKYAEVEAEREQLVLKLKAGNNGRGWFF